MSEIKLSKCPLCGGEINSNEKAYGCSNWKDKDGGCKFVIWKTIAKKDITEDIANQLIENGRTELLDGFISRKNTEFSTHLVLKDGKVEFEFPEK